MDFVTWAGGKVTNWENPLPSSNGKELMRGWTKQKERESIIWFNFLKSKSSEPNDP